ncbi:hypothetical protein M0811_08546 [Anaeramoeba ignava]|uniref:Phosphatidic acid phosphatase type 2/haloperoxidase domain-containing protein n=1 Tax=Anaeramoeba ignava TaxID=1746090 RepID=A0A9Q0RCH0_ANAIG|nr:hypothetical protein M0811_08546 [Anaeramoeba ignava]
MSNCINQLNNNIFNRCMKETPNGIGTIIAKTIYSFIYPELIMNFFVICIMILPWLMFQKKSSFSLDNSLKRRFLLSKLNFINFIHRLCYTFTLDIILYSIFRQRRPCKCESNGDGIYTPVGSIYGMPSGDSLTAALIGTFLIEQAPIMPIISRILGVLVFIFVMFERVILGYHSLGQVISGASLGVALHFYSTRLPQYVTFIDNFLQLVFGAIFLRLDPSLRFGKYDDNNLFGWLFDGYAFIIFESILLFRFYWKIDWKMLKFSYVKMMKNLDPFDKENPNFSVKSKISHLTVSSLSDTFYFWIAFFICLVIQYLAYCFENYGWD